MRSSRGTSERRLEARSCGALVDATSLIVAMTIDPDTAVTNARALDAVEVPGFGAVPRDDASPSSGSNGAPSRSTSSAPALDAPAAAPPLPNASTENALGPNSPAT